MLDIHKIYVPTPYQVGPVNCYLVRNRPYTLIDPGPDSAEGRKGLLKGLADTGVRPDEIERVVITHWHADHSGLVRWLSEHWGAQVYVHRLEEPKLATGYDKHTERLPFLREAGVPEGDIEEILSDRDPLPVPLLPVTGVNLLEGGETFAFDGGEIQVIHMPGHTTGHICLYDAQSKKFIAGDFILAHITPNPFMTARPDDPSQRVPVLAQYLNGLNIMKKMDIGLILTGHGKNISESAAAVEKHLDHRYKRLGVVTGILEGAVLSPYQVMRIMYPGIKGFEIVLGISEVFAYLDYLEEQGAVSHELQNDVSLYYLSS